MQSKNFKLQKKTRKKHAILQEKKHFAQYFWRPRLPENIIFFNDIFYSLRLKVKEKDCKFTRKARKTCNFTGKNCMSLYNSGVPAARICLLLKYGQKPSNYRKNCKFTGHIYKQGKIHTQALNHMRLNKWGLNVPLCEQLIPELSTEDS